MITNEDKLTMRLTSDLKDLLFDELAEEYCLDNDMEYLIGVPIPFKPEDLTSFVQGGLAVTSLADNIVRVIGADTGFKYKEAYLRFLNKFFSNDLTNVLLGNASAELQEGRFRRAAIYMRGALQFDPESADACFLYAYICREWYLSLEGDDFQDLVSVLKGIANEHFEKTTILDENYTSAWYYVGFAYINQGLYAKSGLAWKKFLELKEKDGEKDDETYKEIEDRMYDLVEPIKIEGGINCILSGRLEEGMKTLENYVDSEYSDWWPLHYYLASAYRALGFVPEAIEGFRRVIALSPSNYEATKALYELYAEAGEAELAEKYLTKSQIIQANAKDGTELDLSAKQM